LTAVGANIFQKDESERMKLFEFRGSPVVRMLNRIWQKRWSRILFLLLLAFSVWFAMWAFWYEPSSLTVKNYEIKIAGWHPAHDNFKIVAISDVHGGSNFITEEKIRAIVEQANAQNPDLTVLLGDYVSQQFFDRKKLKMPMPTIADGLRGLRARHGVFAVLGNHDAWHGDSVVRSEFERVGIRVLENEVTTINANGAPFRLLGLPDALKVVTWDSYSNNTKMTLFPTESEGKLIAITHNPDVIVMTTGKLSISPNFVLLLAGHTHGGQVRFPLVGAPVVPSSFGQKYAIGHIVENNVNLFVTPGVGTSIFPVRFRVPPEISVLTLKSF
jgi:uncharacterized protein